MAATNRSAETSGVTADAFQQTSYYLYAGGSLAAEVDGTGAVTRAYTWGDEGLISTQSGNQATFARFDPLGNLSGQLNSLGAVVEEVAYKAYGGSLGGDATNTAFAWQGISGAYTDSSFPGIVLSGSRPYLPQVGRFGSASAAGSGSVTNPYSYAGGNPVGYSAPGEGDEDDFASYGAFYAHTARQGMRELTAMPAFQPGSEDRRKLSDMASAIPVAGEAYAAFEAVTGRDPIAGRCLSAGERMFIAGTFAVSAAAPKILSKFKRLICKLGGGCFVAGTSVQVVAPEEASGQVMPKQTVAAKSKPPETLHTVTKPIEQVREGDLVASRNPVSGKTEFRRVLSTRVRTVTELLIVSLADAKTGKVVETLTTTSEHPFAVEGRGFVPAGQLAIGNAIVTRAGPALRVKSLKVQAHAEGIHVYNFAVDGYHTYFVGKASGGTWVHNPYIPRPQINIPEGNLKKGWQHIDARHVTGNHPTGAGDLFARGTTRAQVTDAAREAVSKGVRSTDPSQPLQTFERRMKVNGQRARYRVVVEMPSGDVVTIFPVFGGK